MRKILVLALCFLAAGCHKKPSAPAVPMVTPVENPDRMIFQAELLVPAEHRAKIKKTDVLLWDLNDGAGKAIVRRIVPVPKFPYEIRVAARDMVRAIPESSVLLFSARIAHFGKEHDPPEKGQLVAMVGTVPPKVTVENPHVDQKRLAKWAKKNDIVADEVLPVGAKVKATLLPSPW